MLKILYLYWFVTIFLFKLRSIVSHKKSIFAKPLSDHKKLPWPMCGPFYVTLIFLVEIVKKSTVTTVHNDFKRKFPENAKLLTSKSTSDGKVTTSSVCFWCNFVCGSKQIPEKYTSCHCLQILLSTFWLFCLDLHTFWMFSRDRETFERLQRLCLAKVIILIVVLNFSLCEAFACS